MQVTAQYKNPSYNQSAWDFGVLRLASPVLDVTPIGINETKQMLMEKFEKVPIQKTYTADMQQFGYLDQPKNKLLVPMHYVLKNNKENQLGQAPLQVLTAAHALRPPRAVGGWRRRLGARGIGVHGPKQLRDDRLQPLVRDLAIGRRRQASHCQQGSGVAVAEVDRLGSAICLELERDAHLRCPSDLRTVSARNGFAQGRSPPPTHLNVGRSRPGLAARSS